MRRSCPSQRDDGASWKTLDPDGKLVLGPVAENVILNKDKVIHAGSFQIETETERGHKERVVEITVSQ